MEQKERMICEIVADAKDGIVPSHEECFWTMLALSAMLHFSRRNLEYIAKAMETGKNLDRYCGITLKSAAHVHAQRFNWMRLTPKKWLGDSGNPFTEANKKWREMGKQIIKEATGIIL
jgi:hypothetical protein